MDPIVSIGGEAPEFHLIDLWGKVFSLAEMRGRITILYFWSAECTWCERVDHQLTKLQNEWQDEVEVAWIASNINEPHELIEGAARARSIPTVLLDTNQNVADLYGAETTPHFFVIDRDGNLVYRGAWDDITFRQRVATQFYVRRVVEALRKDSNPELKETPAYGCLLVRPSE